MFYILIIYVQHSDHLSLRSSLSKKNNYVFKGDFKFQFVYFHNETFINWKYITFVTWVSVKLCEASQDQVEALSAGYHHANKLIYLEGHFMTSIVWGWGKIPSLQISSLAYKCPA